jgi:hypothetical protein
MPMPQAFDETSRATGEQGAYTVSTPWEKPACGGLFRRAEEHFGEPLDGGERIHYK